ncbi:MAG: hypothetical protein IJ997_03605 [Mycoplasmataceae bacterium]|nr:hypothetical protein [Mycoplasmataceae bacterium]
MSSETDQTQYPNKGINPSYMNSEVRLAYYVYTWDQTGKSKQKAGWSTIGTYTLNDNNDIVYTANQNQLIKTNGSNGVAVVGNNYGVIVNNGSDVGPTILRLDGSYITGLDDLAHVENYNILHKEISTVDYHYIYSSSMNSFNLDYVNLWGSSENVLNSSSYSLSTGSDVYFLPFISYSAATVIEPVELAVVGKNSHGINAITNKGFIYNNIEYPRNINIINYYTDMWNYFQDWQYGSNKLGISNYGEISMEFVTDEASNSNITQLSDFDITVIRNFQQKFTQVYSDNEDLDATYKANVDALSTTANILSTIASTIDELLGNTNDEGSISTNTPLTRTLLNSALSALQTWNDSKVLTQKLWEDQHTAIVMEKLPLNNTFMDFNEYSNATSIIGMNNRTKQWIELTLPVSDQSYERIMRNVITNADGNISSGSYSIGSVSQFINNYEIIYSSHGDIYSTASNKITVLSSGGNNGDEIDSNTILFVVDSNNNFVWTSNTYFIQENNLNNSASTYRFIGIESTGDPYSNDQGSNSIKITGFNKILLDDLYENPNTYQDTTVTYYYKDGAVESSTENILEISGDLTSYSVQLTSAIKKDQNVLIGGCGSDGNAHATGSPGVFYIPLPSDIDRDDNNAYVDTHWMLTTWTPNIANNATEPGINNNQNVLYKYTKMNDLITTGLYGGFTPYYNPGSGITAGLLRIPQISYGSNPAGQPVYVTSNENQMAKLSMIMYSNNENGTVTFPNGGNIILYNGNSDVLGVTNGTPIGNIPPSMTSEGDTQFKNYFSTYSHYAACVFTLNSNEKNIILNNAMMNNSPTVGNVAYLDLIGYGDEEFDNLSFDVNRKYIFTFNAHVQVTNLNLMSDQINYGTPSLLLIGHFRNRYCKASLKEEGSNMIYPGRDIFIPLLNKPLENPVNNIYNIEGNYTLSWNTTGTSGGKFENVTDYEMYIPEEAKNYQTTDTTSFENIWKELFDEEEAPTNINNPDSVTTAGNILHFENVLDRIYAFILTGETVNNNLVYQFVNNTTYQNGTTNIISSNDLNLITGNVVNNGTTFTTTSNVSDNVVTFTITGNDFTGTINCTLNDNNEFTNTDVQLTDNTDTTNVLAGVSSDGNTIMIHFENVEGKTSPLKGIEITATLVKEGDDVTGVTVYDNHMLFDLNRTGIDSGILGVNEPMLSMTIQRY